jgi:hypothetical protein
VTRAKVWWIAAPVTALVTALVPAAYGAPADALPTDSTQVRAATPRAAELAAVRRKAIIVFDKNHTDPSSSTLTWKLRHQDKDGVWHVVEKLSWRAGSGMLGDIGRNECAKGRGWLPNGSYRLRFHRDYPGSLIKGRAFRLDDHTCRNGHTRRVALFIHTEQDAGSVQCADQPGDQPCRWEIPEINDYKSAGCIKLAPEDLAELSRHFLRYFHAEVHYSKARVVVRVVA